MKRFFLFFTVSFCLHAALSAQPSVGLSSGEHWANRAWRSRLSAAGVNVGLTYALKP
ncbi:MAG: hypothetical protein RMJ33_04395 [Saprospiraceae bacterium]|nr:hypothetical protein [Saprospiraceae bacterium]MDW8229057.1 hypothetical protein [Saprospiraceae bacterium]